MYEPLPDSSTLRQGDIIRDFCFPRYSFSSTRLVYSIKGGQPEFNKESVLKSDYRFAVVLSQCCEFNENKRNSFSLSALLPASWLPRKALTGHGINLAELSIASKSQLRQMDIEKLRTANTIQRRDENHAVNVFFPEADGKYFSEPMLVDFSQVVSIDMKDAKRIQGNKILQFNDATRQLFKQKLAYFYLR
jgi:hypothetical protein